MSASQVWNTDDLVRLIFSFGDPLHRVWTRHIGDVFKDENDIRTFNMDCIEDDYALYVDNNMYHAGFDMLLSDLFSRKQLKCLLIQMIRCRCCTRHSNSKPKIINKVIEYEPDETKYYNHRDCNCRCRHMARHMWHTIHEIPSRHRLKYNEFYRSPNEIYY